MDLLNLGYLAVSGSLNFNVRSRNLVIVSHILEVEIEFVFLPAESIVISEPMFAEDRKVPRDARFCRRGLFCCHRFGALCGTDTFHFLLRISLGISFVWSIFHFQSLF